MAPGWEPGGCALSPAEGFLLSRIDGRTPWAELREIGGLPPDDVDRTLERWVSEGILVIVRLDGDESAVPQPSAPEPRLEVADEIDASLDISVELQERILAFESDLDRPYCELLGVPRSADVREIKLAYFRLSKEFHPDRYFRREIGTYALRLDRIFKKVVEAYELLSDPATRAEIERSMEAGPPPEEASEAAAASESVEAPSDEARPAGRRAGYRTPSRIENLQRLRRRFRLPPKLLAERQFRARQFFDASRVAAHQENWIEAAATVRLAIAFDPWTREYKDWFAEVQANAHRVRAAALLERLDSSMDESSKQEALRLLEEALHYRPVDAELNHRAALLALDLREIARGLEYAEAACEFGPESAAHFATLCRALRRSGKRDRAREALETARKIDKDDPLVKAEFEQLGRRSRKS